MTSPAHGILLKDGSPTSSFTQADIDNGLISYQENGDLASSDFFRFHVSDPAGNATADAPFQFTIAPPTFTYIPLDDPNAGTFNFNFGTATYVYGLNDVGQIVGAFGVPTGIGGGTGEYGFLENAGIYTTVGPGYVEGTFFGQ